MAIEVSNGVTRIAPTAWKWYVGAGVLALIALVLPDYGWAWGLGAIFLAVFGSGKLSYIQLDRQMLTIKYISGAKRYAWNEITDFRLMKIKSGLITAATMVSFTRVAQEGSLYAKAAKFLSGGTQSAPTYGIKPKTLLILMSAYQQNLIISDEIIAKILGKAKFTKAGAAAAQTQTFFEKPSQSVLHSARPKTSADSAGDMSAADLTMRRAVAERRANGNKGGLAKTVPKAGFAKAKPAAPSRPSFGKASARSSLVQDSHSRRRRTGG